MKFTCSAGEDFITFMPVKGLDPLGPTLMTELFLRSFSVMTLVISNSFEAADAEHELAAVTADRSLFTLWGRAPVRRVGYPND